MLKSNISLVKKNESWVPKKEQQIAAIEKHGYTLGKTLGEGAYAKVKLADSKKHNCKVAIKVINKRRAPKDFLKKFLPREVHLMHRLNHPNVIKLHEVVETSTKVYIILQLASKGDLLEYINNKATLSEDQVRILFCQLAAAMAYCHKEQVAHRDLKCENILIDGEGKLKVTDFGFAISTIKNRMLETFCGSYAYCCPQILRGEPYDGKKADVWSMGVVLYAMACARLPFSDEDMRALAKEGYQGKVKFSKRVSKECRDLVRNMLNVDQNERFSAEQVFRSAWCMKALKENPDLRYLDENLHVASFRKPSECVPQEKDEIEEEESYPVDVQPIHPKIGQKSKVVNCFTFVPKPCLPKQKHDPGRRHTISGFEIHDKSYGLNLRDDLLRNLAEKEMKQNSLDKFEEEKKALPAESYNRHKSRRRSTLVTDVLQTVTPPKEKKNEPYQRKASLVSDVIKFDPKTVAERPGSLAGSKANLLKPPQNQPETIMEEGTNSPETSENAHEPATNQCAKSPRKRMPGGRESRFKEVDKLKYTSAARAAKLAFKEAHISMQANRRLSLQGLDHYLTMQTVVQLRGIEKEPSTNTKFINWKKKFKVALETNT